MFGLNANIWTQFISQCFLVLVQSFSTYTFSRAVVANAGLSLTQTFIRLVIHFPFKRKPIKETKTKRQHLRSVTKKPRAFADEFWRVVTELIGYRERRKFCRSLFLWISDFLCFAGTNFFAIRNDRFFLMGIIFCDFQKVPSYQHIRQLILFYGFYWVRAIEIHVFDQYHVEHTKREWVRCIPIPCKGLTIILLEGGGGGVGNFLLQTIFLIYAPLQSFFFPKSPAWKHFFSGFFFLKC